ncbi:PTS sugar transporter subunit IIA [Xylanimonas oleitrophica]|uniref:Phosphocarrier protein HPr n=1 Tax=Xylanimonas oleitrophica TaxID=2607479 RepID=A0A2W5WXH3_9MICO|nr:dihydroxyacetone kinase phosphoryl donor subunit DhaM [Xylanimonas oleitrophica]PZR55352.1 PTS sugar transporter subunit IIA [Xylanimonas oleitrophica]
MTVALVLVSHSVRLAEGAAELAGQMAPDVVLQVGAGVPGGALGTSLDVVRDAVAAALRDADGAVVLTDLGSAVLTVESALELEGSWAGRVRLAQAPFVEGAVAAAVAAQQDRPLGEVALAAEAAAAQFGRGARGGARAADGPGGLEGGPGRVSARVVVRDPLGLHARPAALLARAVADLGVPVTVDGVDASSVLMLLQLGVRGGREVEVAAQGPGAEGAVREVVALIEGGLEG